MTSLLTSPGVRVVASIALGACLTVVGGCARSIPFASVRGGPGVRATGPTLVSSGDRLALAALRLGVSQDEGPPPPRVQTPIVGSTRVTLENNFLFEAGADRENGCLAGLRVPHTSCLSGRWNLIHWPILPVLFVPGYVPGLPSSGEPPASSFGDTSGIGDFSYWAFLSPRTKGSVVWGLGPAISIPSASAEVLGTGKWSGGVAALIAKAWDWGGASVIARHHWSFAGDPDRSDVEQTLIRPVVTYKLRDGWFVVSSPTIVANFPAKPSQRWTLPVGMGVGRINKVGSQLVDVTLGAYFNALRPTDAPRWQIRLTVGLIFPKKTS